jgi:hypothetical protein
VKRLLLALAVLALWPAAASAAPAVVTTPNGLELLHFDTDAPGTITERHAITGLQPTERIAGIDVRPATGQLYGLGIVPGVQDTGRIYVIDPGTGVATQLGPGPFSTTLTPSEYGFDFNPAADRIRVVNRADQNIRVNPNNGALVQVDTPLMPAGDVDAIAYDQNVAAVPQTTLWGYDSGIDRLVRIGGVNGNPSANMGQVTVFGSPSGISTAGRAGMDIPPSGIAFLSAQTGTVSSLYLAHLGTGIVAKLGDFPEIVDDLARLQGSSFAFEDPTAFRDEDSPGPGPELKVTRFGNIAGTQTVSFATSDGTATVGNADYNGAGATLTFAPGETSKTISLSVNPDAADEPNEFVNFALSNPTSGATLASPSTGTFTIVDDDGPPVIVPPDTVAPTLLVSAPPTRTRRQILGGVLGRFSVSEACVGALQLRLGNRTLGTRRIAPTSTARRRYRLKLTGAGRARISRQLRRRRRARVTVVGTCIDPAGNTGTDRTGITVRRR